MLRFLDIKPREFPIVLGMIAVMAFVWFEWIAWRMYAGQFVYLADAGLFDSMCSGPLHGNWFRTPISWNIDANFHGNHFSPGLLLITPFYLFCDHFMTYLTVLRLATVGAMIPLAYWVRDVTRSPIMAVVFSLLYLCNHFTLSITTANHIEAMALPAIFGMFLAAERNKRVAYWICWGVVMCWKETFSIFIALWALSRLLEPDREKRILGAWTLGACVLWFPFARWMMWLNGADVFTAAADSPFTKLGDAGQTPLELALHLVTHPGQTFSNLFLRPAPGEWPVILLLYASVGFLPLCDKRTFWLAGVAAALYVAIDFWAFRRLLYYYSYGALPLLIYSAVRGAGALLGKAESGPRPRVLIVLLAVCVGLSCFQATRPTRSDALLHSPTSFPVEERHKMARQIARELIPEDAAVAAQYKLFCQVPHRKVLLPILPDSLDEVDYVFVDSRSPLIGLHGDEPQQVVERLQSPEFEQLEEFDGLIILRKVAAPK